LCDRFSELAIASAYRLTPELNQWREQPPKSSDCFRLFLLPSYTVRANGIPCISTAPSVLHLFFAGPNFVRGLLILRLTLPNQNSQPHRVMVNWQWWVGDEPSQPKVKLV